MFTAESGGRIDLLHFCVVERPNEYRAIAIGPLQRPAVITSDIESDSFGLDCYRSRQITNVDSLLRRFSPYLYLVSDYEYIYTIGKSDLGPNVEKIRSFSCNQDLAFAVLSDTAANPAVANRDLDHESRIVTFLMFWPAPWRYSLRALANFEILRHPMATDPTRH